MNERAEKPLRLVEANRAKGSEIDARSALINIDQLVKRNEATPDLSFEKLHNEQHTGSIPELYDSELLARLLSGSKTSS